MKLNRVQLSNTEGFDGCMSSAAAVEVRKWIWALEACGVLLEALQASEGKRSILIHPLGNHGMRRTDPL